MIAKEARRGIIAVLQGMNNQGYQIAMDLELIPDPEEEDGLIPKKGGTIALTDVVQAVAALASQQAALCRILEEVITDDGVM